MSDDKLNDPLEAAKAEKPWWRDKAEKEAAAKAESAPKPIKKSAAKKKTAAAKKKTAAAKPKSPLDLPELDEKDKAPPTLEPEPAPAPTTAEAEAPPASTRKKYRVTKGKTVSINGAMTHVATGAELDSLGYGEVGIERIRKQGVELELLEVVKE